MEILAICLSRQQTLEFNGRRAQTGICKQAVPGPVRVTKEGVEGDVQVDRENHGGADKAVYAYAVENYRHWETELGRHLPYGQFGENLAVSGMIDEAVHIGDIFRIGALECQVTQPRVPCFKLGLRMEDPGFVRRFHQSGRVGFYLRVLQEGELQPGDAIGLLQADPGQLNIRDAMLALNKNPRQQEIIRRALEIPALSQAWRESLEKKQNE
jgi:MOSC domain-containing protein YiiM